MIRSSSRSRVLILRRKVQVPYFQYGRDPHRILDQGWENRLRIGKYAKGAKQRQKSPETEAIVTWVSTSMTSTPWNATVRTFATIPFAPYKRRLNIAVYGRKCQHRRTAGNPGLW